MFTTKAIVVEAVEKDGFLYVIVEIAVYDDKGDKLKVLTRTPLDPMPINATEQDIRDQAGGLLEKYFPEPVKPVITDRPDLVGIEVGSSDGVKEGVTVRVR